MNIQMRKLTINLKPKMSKSKSNKKQQLWTKIATAATVKQQKKSIALTTRNNYKNSWIIRVRPNICVCTCAYAWVWVCRLLDW